eukprot:2220982-Karenia_brevis.AAC.1
MLYPLQDAQHAFAGKRYIHPLVADNRLANVRQHIKVVWGLFGLGCLLRLKRVTNWLNCRGSHR